MSTPTVNDLRNAFWDYLFTLPTGTAIKLAMIACKADPQSLSTESGARWLKANKDLLYPTKGGSHPVFAQAEREVKEMD